MKPLFIAITGPSASGKSRLSETLNAMLQVHEDAGLRSQVLSEDAYYRDQAHLSGAERLLVNYDHPDALEHELLARHLARLAGGESIEAPVYDFATHTRTGARQVVPAAPVMIVEGALLLSNRTLAGRFDLKVFLDIDLDTCLQRRIARDTRQRGRSREAIVAQFESCVRPMYERFCLPARAQADIILSHGEPQDTGKQLLDAVIRLQAQRGRETAR